MGLNSLNIFFTSLHGINICVVRNQSVFCRKKASDCFWLGGRICEQKTELESFSKLQRDFFVCVLCGFLFFGPFFSLKKSWII